MFKAIAGVIAAFFVMTSGAPSLLLEKDESLAARNNDALHHNGLTREFYVFPAFLRGKFAKRKVGYLVFSNHEIDKPRFLSLKDKRYGEALSLIEASGIYRGAPSEQAFSPLFDSSVYRKPSFTIRRGIIIPKNEEKILQRKTEATELLSSDDNFESSLIQRLQDLKKESHSRSSGIDQEQGPEESNQAEVNNALQKPAVSDSDDSFIHMAFDSDVGFDVDLEGFLNDESAQSSQVLNNNANDDQSSSGIFETNFNNPSDGSSGIKEDSSVKSDGDHFSQTSFADDGNVGDVSESLSPNNQQPGNKILSSGSADNEDFTNTGSSAFNLPFSSLHISPEEIVQAILAMSDSINTGNSQDDLPRNPFRIFDGTLIASRINNQAESLFRLANHPSTPLINDDVDVASSIFAVPYTKSESLLLINQDRSTANKPIYIKTYILRFRNRNRHSQNEDITTSESFSNSQPSAVILGFRDAVNHGLAEGIPEVLSVRLVEDNEEIKENLRNKRHVFSFDFDNISIEVLE